MEATPKKKTLNNLQFFDPQISIINLPAIFVHPHQTCFLAKPYMHISVCLFSTYARFSLSVSQRLNNHAISPITGQNPPNRTRKLHLRTRKSTESNLSHLSHLRGAQLKDLIYAFDDKASAYGDLSKLRKFVEEDGASVVIPDGNGYYALQWASLNNFPDIAQYIIERGGDVHATDHMKQTALHWAAVRGSVAVADVLLQNGAPVEASDINGYWAVHIAAQYGQTGFLNFIVAKFHAEFDVPDNDGRSPLHWAAYKGFTDTVRLLLFRDASQERQDKEGTKW